MMISSMKNTSIKKGDALRSLREICWNEGDEDAGE